MIGATVWSVHDIAEPGNSAGVGEALYCSQFSAEVGGSALGDAN